MSAGRLTATISASDALQHAAIALVCVGTPSEKDGNLNLEQLHRVVFDIAECFRARSRPLIVAIRSTVFPGTCEDIVIPALDGAIVVSNPEFLREGVAIKGFMEPGLVVVGGSDPEAVRAVAALYSPLSMARLVSLRTAELIKYTCNAFHSLKIAFANEIGALGSKLDIDAQDVMATLGQRSC